jgi:chemotaxis protein histidine kinase CheA
VFHQSSSDFRSRTLREIFYQKQQKEVSEKETPQREDKSNDTSDSEQESDSDEESSDDSEANDKDDDPLAASESVLELTKAKNNKNHSKNTSKRSARHSTILSKVKEAPDAIRLTSSTISLTKKTSPKSQTPSKLSSASSVTSNTADRVPDLSVESLLVGNLSMETKRAKAKPQPKSKHKQHEKGTKKKTDKKKNKEKDKKPKEKKKNKAKEQRKQKAEDVTPSDETMSKQSRLIAELRERTTKTQVQVTPLWKLARQNRSREESSASNDNFDMTSPSTNLTFPCGQSSPKDDTVKDWGAESSAAPSPIELSTLRRSSLPPSSPPPFVTPRPSSSTTHLPIPRATSNSPSVFISPPSSSRTSSSSKRTLTPNFMLPKSLRRRSPPTLSSSSTSIKKPKSDSLQHKMWRRSGSWIPQHTSDNKEADASRGVTAQHRHTFSIATTNLPSVFPLDANARPQPTGTEEFSQLSPSKQFQRQRICIIECSTLLSVAEHIILSPNISPETSNEQPVILGHMPLSWWLYRYPYLRAKSELERYASLLLLSLTCPLSHYRKGTNELRRRDLIPKLRTGMVIVSVGFQWIQPR